MVRIAGLIVVFVLSTLAATAQPMSIPHDSRLKSIVDKKVLRVAYRSDATPYSYRTDQQEPVGYSIDLCRLVAKSIEQQFSLPELKIEWVPVTVQTRFSTVADNKADMECGSSTVTLGRMKEVDFSNIIFIESTGVVVARSSNLRSFADLTGKKIAVVAGSSNESAVRAQLRVRNLEASVVPVKDRAEGIAAIEGGKVDAYGSDKLLLVGAQMTKPELLTMLPDDLSVEPYAIVLPRGDWALRLAVNTGLSQVFRSGQNGEVFRRWFERIGLRPGVLLGAAYTLGGLAD